MHKMCQANFTTSYSPNLHLQYVTYVHVDLKETCSCKVDHPMLSHISIRDSITILHSINLKGTGARRADVG